MKDNSFFLLSIQAPANHLLSASVMSAPAALAISKLFWPESKETKRDTSNDACVIKRYKAV